MNNATKLTGLWKNKDKTGKSFLAGSISPTARLVIFENGFKQKESDPDYIAYLVPAEARDESHVDQATPHVVPKRSRQSA